MADWDRAFDDIRQELQTAYQTEVSFQSQLDELIRAPAAAAAANRRPSRPPDLPEYASYPLGLAADPQLEPISTAGAAEDAGALPWSYARSQHLKAHRTNVIPSFSSYGAAQPPVPYLTVAAPDSNAALAAQRAAQQHAAQAVQYEMQAVRRELAEQVAACWQARLAELEFVLKERFGALQELYDSNRLVILEVGNRMLAFKREVRNDVQRYNHLMESIVHQFKHLLKDEVTRLYEAVAELRAEREKSRAEAEQRCRALEEAVAREWRQCRADVAAQQQALEERVGRDVRALHGTVTETVDVVQTQVQERLDRIDNQVVGVVAKKASLTLAQEQAEQRFIAAADRRVEYLEGEVDRLTGVVLQLTERQRQDQLDQLERLHRTVAEQVAMALQQLAPPDWVGKECSGGTADRSLRKLKDGLKELARDVRRTQSDTEQLQRRLEEVRQQPPTAKGFSAAEVQPSEPLAHALQEQVADLQGTVRRLQTQPGPQNTVDSAALHNLKAWVEARLADVGPAPARGAPPAAAAPAGPGVAELRQLMDSLQSSVRGLESRVSLLSDERGSRSPSRAAGVDPGGLSKATQEYVDEQVAVLSGELSALRHTVTRKLEPQVERLAKAGAGGGPDGGGGGGGSVDIPALKEALRDWVDELVQDCFNLYLSHIKERIASQELRLQRLEGAAA